MFTSFWIIILSSLLYCCGPAFGQYEDDQPMMEEHQNQPQLEPQQSEEPQDVRQSSTPESKQTSGNNPLLQDTLHRQHQYHHSPSPPSSTKQQQQQQQQQLVFKPINDYIQGKSTILEQQFQPAVDSINDLFVKVEPEPPTAEIHSKEEKSYAHKPYGFGYDIDDGYGNKQWRHEKSSSPNQVTGSYGYKDKNGVMREVQYIADKYGFRAMIKTTEPGTASSDPAYVRMNANPLPVEYYPAKEYPPSATVEATVAASAINRKAKDMATQYPGELSLLNGGLNRPPPETQIQQQPPPLPAAALLDNDVGNFLSLFTPNNLNTNNIQQQQQQPQQHYQTNRNSNGPRLVMRSASSASSVVSSLPPLSFEPNDNDYRLESGTSGGDPNIIDYPHKPNPY